MFDNVADQLITEILQEKMRLEKEGFSPRLILIGEKPFELLKADWIKSYKALPWGDTISYELDRKASNRIFLGDGSLLDLWVVRVNTIEGFEVR